MLFIALTVRHVSSVHFRGTINTRYNYDDEDNSIGINHWNELDSTCKGRYQSPINIDTRIAHRGHFQQPLQLRNLNASILELEVVNSGTTAEFNVKFRGDKPEITDGPLNSTYVLDTFHYHWGILDEEGSEHTINSRQYSMEGHYVFYNKKYRSEANAGQYPNGFVVLAVLYEVASRTSKMNIWDMVDAVVFDGEKHTLRNPKFTLANLIPESFIYAHYRGSFTTPPCMENVDWVVALDIQRIHPHQIRNFRHLVSANKVPIADNFRPLQAINGRRIQIGSKLKDDDDSYHDVYQPIFGTGGGTKVTYDVKDDDFAFPNVRDPDSRYPSFYG